MKSLIKAVFGKLIIGTFFLFIAVAAHAQSTANGAGQTENTATVKYLGMQEDMIVFDVYYPNPEGNKFQLTVKDQDGSQLYQNNFSDKAFYKQFRLPKADKNKVFFILRNNRDADITKAFEVNVSSRFIQEVAVKKL